MAMAGYLLAERWQRWTGTWRAVLDSNQRLGLLHGGLTARCTRPLCEPPMKLLATGGAWHLIARPGQRETPRCRGRHAPPVYEYWWVHWDSNPEPST